MRRPCRCLMGSSTHKKAEVVLFADELANVPADQSGYATMAVMKFPVPC
jgi:hypothetical protein